MLGSGVAEFEISASGGILVARWHLLALLAGWSLAFAVAARSLVQLPRRTAMGLLVAGTLAFTGLAVAGHPELSDDLYRYAWDGHVQASGIDPYRYPPDDPRLSGLRDPWLWPDPAGCAQLHRPAGCTRLNRPDARTIYPPVAQEYFRFLHATGLTSWRERGLQLPTAVAHLALTGLLLAALRSLGRDPRRAVLYAWCPLALLETGMDAHVDVLAVGLAVGAVWAMERRRSAVAGLLLGFGTAVKLLPALLLPVALRRPATLAGRNAAVRRWTTVLGCWTAVLGLAYLPHVLAVGPAVLGYLPNYLQEENYGSGSRFLLLGLIGLSGRVAQDVALVVIAGAAGWSLLRRHAPAARVAVELTGIVFLVVTPVQPWYALLLVALAAFAGRAEWLLVALAGYPLYFAAVLNGNMTVLGRLPYGIAAVGVIAATGVRHFGEPGRSRHPAPSKPDSPDAAAARN